MSCKIFIVMIISLVTGCTSVKTLNHCPDVYVVDYRGIERQEIKLACW